MNKFLAIFKLTKSPISKQAKPLDSNINYSRASFTNRPVFSQSKVVVWP